MKKKINAILLFACLTAALLSACANDDEPRRADEHGITLESSENGYIAAAEPEPSHWDILGGRSFNGRTFTILDANDNPAMWHNVPTEELTGEAINDALINRNIFIEDTFDIVLEYVQIVGHGNGTNRLRQSIHAGEDRYDMIIGRVMGGELATLATGGFLQNLADMPYLSLEAPWWSRLMYQNLQFDGNLFFTMGDIVPSMYQASSAMFFNRQMLLDYGHEDNLYELVFEGRWTIDVLEQLTRDVDQDLTGDGMLHSATDIFGILVQGLTTTSDQIATSAGIRLATVRDGEIAVEFNTQAVADKIYRLGEIYRRTPWNSHQNELIDITFHEGRGMFLPHFLEAGILQLRDMEQDYGILPMPKFDELQESYISFINGWNCAFVGMPLNADSSRAAFIMEAKAYASYNTVRPQVYDVVLHHRAARDEESARIIDMIIETSYLDLNAIYNWGGSTDVLSRAMFDGQPLISNFEAREGAIQAAIENFVNAMRGE